MRRLWLRWGLLIVFVAALGVVFVNLGEWQLDRLAQRRERNATTITNEQKPVRPYEQVFTRPIIDADQWQRVEARGTFDAEHQFVVRYRSNGNLDGYEVVTPLRTASGVVLVDRGFIPLQRGTQIPSAAPAPPAGEVTVVGHVRRSEKGRRAATTPVGNQMRLINSDAIAATLPYPIKSGYIGLLTVQPEQVGGFQPIQLPDLSEGPHFWYAVQWFMFTAVGVAGIVVFIRGDLRARREEREDATEAHATV
ncbi:MAG TPA: SURF1 family protein [Propionibacteriaceae bacterium]|nr:SURF1 family protein [Propionibacteriaceae bacterium]